MKNSTAPQGSKDTCTNVVYKFSCPERMCKSSSKCYIGHTTTTIRRRFKAHRNQGAIHQHFIDAHDRKPTLQELIDNTDIIHKENNYGRLKITEAVSITLQNPSLNRQQEADQILPSNKGKQRIRRPRFQEPNPPPSGATSPMQTRRIDANVTELIRSLRPRPRRPDS